MSKALVLFSGGMDSTTALYEANQVYDEVVALSFVYGSKHNWVENIAAEHITDNLKVERRVVELDFNDWGFKSDLLTSGGDVPEGHYADESMKSTVVPFRNGILLSIAAGIAESMGASKVWYGAHGGDHPIYPDCRPEFFEAMLAAVRLGTDKKVSIRAPFMHVDKAHIVKQGVKLAVPYEHTWSCYQPKAKTVRAGATPDGAPLTVDQTVHCGRCGTCVERKEAFEQAGVNDPTEYE